MNTNNTITVNKPQQLLAYSLGLAGLAVLSAQFIGASSVFPFSSTDTADNEARSTLSQAPTITIRPLEDMHKDMSLRQVEAVFSANLRGPAKAKAKEYAKHLMQLSAIYNFSPSILLALMSAESAFRTRVVSNMGAMGLMQVKPSTALYIAKKFKIKSYRRATDLFNPTVNMTIGTAYLAYLRDRFQNSVHYVAAYNLGPTTVSVMLKENRFELGKVAKYVTEIHNGTLAHRKASALNPLYAAQ